MLRSHRWAKRSINAFNSKLNYEPKNGSSGRQEMYSIIQGGVFKEI